MFWFVFVDAGPLLRFCDGAFAASASAASAASAIVDAIVAFSASSLSAPTH